MLSLFFFFNDTATTEIYTLSLHDALPISCAFSAGIGCLPKPESVPPPGARSPSTAILVIDEPDARKMPSDAAQDRKSTRLNSSHLVISYAVFCLKKKQNDKTKR